MPVPEQGFIDLEQLRLGANFIPLSFNNGFKVAKNGVRVILGLQEVMRRCQTGFELAEIVGTVSQSGLRRLITGTGLRTYIIWQESCTSS